MSFLRSLTMWAVIVLAAWALSHRREAYFGFTSQSLEATAGQLRETLAEAGVAGDRAYRHVAAAFESIDDTTQSLGLPKRSPRFDKI